MNSTQNYQIGGTIKATLNTGDVDVPSWKTSPSYPPTASFTNSFPANHPGFVAYVNDVNSNSYTNGNACVADLTDGNGDQFLAWGSGNSGASCVAGSNGGYHYGYEVVDGNVALNLLNNTDANANQTQGPLFAQLYLGRALGFGAKAPNTGSRTFGTTFLSFEYNGRLNDNIDQTFKFLNESLDTSLQSSDMLAGRFLLGLAGFGGPGCGVEDAANPGSAVAGEGNCQFWNPFSNSIEFAYPPGNDYSSSANPHYDPSLANSQELIDWLIPELWTELNNELMVLEYNLSGEDLFQLGGGSSDWAAGVQYRSETYSADYQGYVDATDYPCNSEFNTDAASCPSDTGVTAFLSPGVDFDLSQTVIALFGEVSLPFSDKFFAQAALRFESYSESDASFDYKFAGKYTLNDNMALRFSTSTSFKAPALSQTSLDEATSLSFIGAIGTFKAIDTSTAEGGLKPESASNLNLGYIFENEQHFASVDYWSIDVSDAIVTESHTDITTTACPDNVCHVDNQYYDRLSFTETSTPDDDGNTPLLDLARVAVFVQNAGELSTSGIDVKYAFNFGEVNPMTLGAELSILSSYELDGTDHVGELNQPDGSVRPLPEQKLKLFYNGLFNDMHNVRVNYNSASSVTDERSGYGTVDEFTTIDVAYTLSFANDRGTFNVTMFNLLDEDAPLARLDLSYDPYTANALGQTTKLGLTYRF